MFLLFFLFLVFCIHSFPGHFLLSREITPCRKGLQPVIPHRLIAQLKHASYHSPFADTPSFLHSISSGTQSSSPSTSPTPPSSPRPASVSPLRLCGSRHRYVCLLYPSSFPASCQQLLTYPILSYRTISSMTFASLNRGGKREGRKEGDGRATSLTDSPRVYGSNKPTSSSFWAKVRLFRVSLWRGCPFSRSIVGFWVSWLGM